MSSRTSRPVRSDSLGHTLMSKKVALPVFSSDALSSVSYATEEVLIVLGAAGVAFFWTTPWIALGVVVLFAVISASYMQTVKEYPNGGGDYVVAHENVSKQAGIFTGAALLVDYVLTVAVSMSAGVMTSVMIARPVSARAWARISRPRRPRPRNS